MDAALVESSLEIAENTKNRVTTYMTLQSYS